MDIGQVSRLLNHVGKLTTYQDNCIKEDAPPYENYYMLEKSGEKWEYGLFTLERENNPYLRKIKEFNTEAEGAKYFLLDRLSSYYYSERVGPFIMDHTELDIGGQNFDENKLVKALSLVGIPSSLYVIDKSQIKGRAIMLTQKDDTNSIVSFIDSIGNTVQSTVPINNQRALLVAFRKVFMLYLFETEVNQLLEAENITNVFTDKDINIFLS